MTTTQTIDPQLQAGVENHPSGGDSENSAVKAETSEPTATKKTPKAKKEKVAPAPLLPEGVVIYSDAGTKPNPGFGGWGIHGYLYNTQLPKKGTGNPLIRLTADGYQLKAEADLSVPEVTPMKYLDGMGTIPYCSNNGGEVIAMGEGLRFAARYDLKKVQLYTDSQYAINNLVHVPQWEAQNWIKRDGTPIRNIDQWKQTRAAFDALIAKNVDVSISWVKGHATNVGNLIVDRYATMGRESATAQESVNHIEVSEPDGYWAGEERHPFIYHKHVYMTSSPAHNTPGEYYLGDHGKDKDPAKAAEDREKNGGEEKENKKLLRGKLLGKRIADASYAYVLLKQPDELIEIVRNNMLRLSDRRDALTLTSLDQIYTSSISRDLKRFNENALHRPWLHKLDLHTADKTPIMTELSPPLIAVRAIEAVNHLKGLLLDFQNNPEAALVKTEFTDQLFSPDEKDKDKVKLTADLGAGVTTIKVTASYAKECSPERAQTEFVLVLGVDLPERNALKRLEKLHPKVTLVTWREHKAIRHATVVECDDGIGIWAGYYANTKYLKE